MIIFSKKSLHYKFNNLVGSWAFYVNATTCNSLCSYFWSTLFNIVMSLFWVLVGYMILTMGGLVFAKVFNLEKTIMMWTYLWILGTITIAVVMACIGGCIASVSYLIDKCITHKETHLKQQKEPSVVAEWVKAKKSKICPMITFKE